MKAFVLDCSVTMAWFFSDQMTEKSNDALEALKSRKALVPSLWELEVANVLAAAERKRVVQSEQATEFLHVLRKLPIESIPISRQAIFGEVRSLAVKYALSAYDACYLYLAISEKLPLVSMDKDLSRAAERVGLPAF